MRTFLLPLAAAVAVFGGSCNQPTTSEPLADATLVVDWEHVVSIGCTRNSDQEAAGMYQLNGSSTIAVHRPYRDSSPSIEIVDSGTTLKVVSVIFGTNCDMDSHDAMSLVAKPALRPDWRTTGRVVNTNGKMRLELQFKGSIGPAIVQYRMKSGQTVERAMGDSSFTLFASVPYQQLLYWRDTAYSVRVSGPDPDRNMRTSVAMHYERPR